MLGSNINEILSDFSLNFDMKTQKMFKTLSSITSRPCQTHVQNLMNVSLIVPVVTRYKVVVLLPIFQFLELFATSN